MKQDSTKRVKGAEREREVSAYLKKPSPERKLDRYLGNFKTNHCPLISNKITELTFMYSRQERSSAEGLLVH